MKGDTSRHKKMKKNKINKVEKNYNDENKEISEVEHNLKNMNQVSDKNESISNKPNKEELEKESTIKYNADDQVISLKNNLQKNLSSFNSCEPSEILNEENNDKNSEKNDNKGEETELSKSEILTTSSAVEDDESDYVNPRGVRFVQDGRNGVNIANIPYGLPCLRELMRFLISLINSKNSELMITMGLNLITIGLESGIDHISSFQTLLSYIKDDLSKNLYHLISTERISIFASILRVTFLLFESLRGNLKLQMEHFFIKLMEVITSESTKISIEQKEMSIDFFLQMLRIPGFAVELYLNYDCCLNCTNLFEDLTKLLSKVFFSIILKTVIYNN
jgi:hypothetical protein